MLDIKAAQFEIREAVNNISVSDFISVDSNFELFENVLVDSLTINELSIGGEINSISPDASINGWNVKNAQSSYLSRKNAQIVKTPFHIQTAIIRGRFNANLVNGFNFMEAKEILDKIKTNEQILKEPSVAIDKMIVNGSITFNQINGENFEKLKTSAIHLNQLNSIEFPVIFLDSATIQGNLTTEKLNEIQFEPFVNDLVKKTDENIIIYGRTVFKEDVIVLDSIETTTINDILVKQILTRNYKEHIVNPIHVFGDVTVSKLTVDGTFNGANGSALLSYNYDEQRQAFILHRNVFFDQSTYINYLNLNGGYNNVDDAKLFLKSIVRIDRPAVIIGTKTFHDQIHFENDIYISQYNEINMQNFLSNIVLIDSYETVNIYANVIFTEAVKMVRLAINDDLVATSLSNCSIVDWYTNAIRIDEPFSYDGTVIFSGGTFESTNLNAQTLNNHRLEHLLTLNTPQTFSEPIRFDNVDARVPISTGGTVSGYNLPNERANTLMVRPYFHIDWHIFQFLTPFF